MKEILLSQNKVALVDDEDFDRINSIKWHACHHHGNFYALHCKYIGIENGKQKMERRKMHRMVLNVLDPKIKVDHINGNGLDNRKENLRVSDGFQNQRNRQKIHKRNTSGFRGVSYCSSGNRTNRWVAQIRIPCGDKTKRKNLGYFPTPEEAAKAFDKAAKEIYGEFCGKLNFD